MSKLSVANFMPDGRKLEFIEVAGGGMLFTRTLMRIVCTDGLLGNTWEQVHQDFPLVMEGVAYHTARVNYRDEPGGNHYKLLSKFLFFRMVDPADDKQPKWEYVGCTGPREVGSDPREEGDVHWFV